MYTKIFSAQPEGTGDFLAGTQKVEGLSKSRADALSLVKSLKTACRGTVPGSVNLTFANTLNVDMNKSSIIKILLISLIWLAASPSQAVHGIKEVADIPWAKPKGFELTTDIYTPDTDGKKLPVLIIYHGGGWLLNTKSIMTDMARYMAAHSELVVVNMNYRRLGDLDNTTTVNEIIEDALGAVLWVKDNIERYNGDPEKIAVTGDSAGGHLAAMVTLAGRRLESDGFKGETLGFNPTYLPRGKTAEQIAREDGAGVQAVVLSYAGFDLVTMAKNGFETAGNPFWGWAKASPRGVFGKGISVESNAGFYEAVSPINYIVDRKHYPLPPQFVFVGEHDNLIRPEVVANYADLLKKAEQPVETKVYKNRGHGFLDSGCNDYTKGCFKDLAVPALDDMIEFLNKVFNPKAVSLLAQGCASFKQDGSGVLL